MRGLLYVCTVTYLYKLRFIEDFEQLPRVILQYEQAFQQEVYIRVSPFCLRAGVFFHAVTK